MMLRNYTYRQFIRRPGRTLLTLGGIVIGVAGVFAIAVSVNTTRHAYQRMFADLAGATRSKSWPTAAAVSTPRLRLLSPMCRA